MTNIRPKLNISVFVLALIYLTSCAITNSGETSATSTAQAERAIRMATDIAVGNQATVAVINQQALATADARQRLFADAIKWPLVFEETYAENIRDWAEGSETDPVYAESRWSFVNGKYLWEATAYDGFVWWVRPDMATYADFLLSVTAKQVDSPEIGEHGLIFRQTTEEDYYLFELDGAGNYAFFIKYNGEWENLLDWKYSPEIKLGDDNRLAVIASGDEFLFYINDVFVDATRDDRLEAGKAGLLIGLSDSEQEGSWEFDDFEIRAVEVAGDIGTPTP